MILHKLVVSNFKAVEEESIEFGDSGITLIEGRNESGKTSIFEAFRLLINVKATSNTVETRAAQRVDSSEPVTITAEMTIDGERIRFSKCFSRKKSEQGSSVEFISPVKTSLRDDEAHNYVLAKLETSANVKLWEKLSLRQDEESTRLDSVDEISSLKEALDAEAGETVDSGDDSLFRLVKAERDSYLTANGSPRGQLKKLHDEVSQLTSEFEGAREAAESLSADVDKLSDIEHKLREKRKILDERKVALGVAEEKAGNLAKVERSNEEFAQRTKLATISLENAAHSRDRRSELAETSEKLRTNLETLNTAMHGAESDEKEAAKSLVEAESAYASAETAAKKISIDLADVVKRTEEIELRKELSSRQTRHEKVEQLTAKSNELKALKGRIKADQPYVDGLREAQAEMREAEAALKAGSSLIEVGGSGNAIIDGETVNAADGWTGFAENAVRLEIGGVRIDVVPPKNAADAKAKFDDAKRAFSVLLADRDYESISAAEADLKKLAELETKIAEIHGQRESALGENTADGNLERIEELKAQLAEFPSRTSAFEEETSVPLDQTLDELKSRRRELESALENANVALAEAQGVLNQARLIDVEARGKTQSLTSALDSALIEHQDATSALDSARSTASDEKLENVYSEAKKAVDDLEAEGRSIAELLEEARRDALLHDLDSARGALSRHQTEFEELVRRRTELNSQISFQSGQGLATKKDEAQIALQQATQRRDSMQARANAADLLLKTLEIHRQKLISRYSAPLRDRLVHYGRLIFGKDFDVSLDERLRVKERKLDGTTISFEHLSGGAKEQFALMTRLVCAELVGNSSVPIFLDDTLGFTDPTRRQAMAAVLNEAGKSAQVIILTCDESRFEALGSARKHSMS